MRNYVIYFFLKFTVSFSSVYGHHLRQAFAVIHPHIFSQAFVSRHRVVAARFNVNQEQHVRQRAENSARNSLAINGCVQGLFNSVVIYYYCSLGNKIKLMYLRPTCSSKQIYILMRANKIFRFDYLIMWPDFAAWSIRS